MFLIKFVNGHTKKVVSDFYDVNSQRYVNFYLGEKIVFFTKVDSVLWIERIEE
jgi:hypothetical protein